MCSFLSPLHGLKDLMYCCVYRLCFSAIRRECVFHRSAGDGEQKRAQSCNVTTVRRNGAVENNLSIRWSVWKIL